MAKASPSKVFTTLFELLADEGVARGDEVVDDAMRNVAQQMYEFSKEYGYDPTLAQDALDMLGVEP